MTADMRIPLHDLREITNGFSVDSRIGKGGYGDVYKGVYNGREVAVKLLQVEAVHGIDDKEYINEVGNLSMAKHPNIVQLLGYSYETTSELVENNGNRRFRQHIYRALCFEYLEGGSLDARLREESLASDWSTRYMIIKGICEGLYNLHQCKPSIFHLDLKPANILLDSEMVPKLADFGLSRLFSGSHTHVTEQIKGTQRYMPPEFINDGKISNKNDVFSFGVVMIEIMTGSLACSNYAETDEVAQFKPKVYANWKNMVEVTSLYPSEELHQVQTCIDTALRCVEPDRNKRPTIADVLDILNNTETHIPKRQMADVLPCPTIGPKSTESNTSEMMVAELNDTTNEHGHSSSMTYSSNRTVQQILDRETSSDVEEVIIGRVEEKQKILSILSESITEEMVILPIYGIGGIGKTTLAQLVFNDPQFQDYTRVWIYVSQEFNLNNIGNSIVTQLTDKSSNIPTKQMLHKRLEEVFASKNILIVLDDLWEENPKEFHKLKVMLGLGLGSKVIIVTTRDGDLARKICSPAVTPYKLETLTANECWTIIKQKAGFEGRVDKEQLEHIGREIASKCGGVALAAQSLGYMLNGMKSDEWESVRDSDIWNLSTSNGREVLASLELSYRHMSPGLQLCFKYCAIFPKGNKIEKYYLIYQWIALGNIEQSSIFDIIQLSENYVTQLLGMSFLQYSKTPLSDRNQDKDATLFTMHDLVHDLAKEILSHQLNTGGNKCRYASLTDCTKSLQSLVNFPANIEALRFQDSGEQLLCGGAFSSAKCLRVLDLSECLIDELPGCIGQLKQLRFLHAPCLYSLEIPNCITELSELNYLNLRWSYRMSALPESIGYSMKGLMHLDLSGCFQIRELPVSFSELKQLVHLDLSGCNVFLAEALGGCTKLQYLNLSVGFTMDYKRITGLPKVIGNLIKLRYLNLGGCVDRMGPRPPPGRSPDWEEEIHMLLRSISTLSNLEHLDLSHYEQVLSIPESFGNLTKLHTLDLSGCWSPHKLPDSIFKMVSLKVLIDSSHFEVCASSDKRSSNISLLQRTNPDELEIDKLENVKSAEEATSVKLIEKQEMSSLTFRWTLGAERFVDDKVVLEKLVPPSSVDELSIFGYRSLSIPDWFMDIRQYLPNLSDIYLCDFPNCNNLLPPLGQLPNLEKLTLHHMEGLAEWNATHYSGKEGSSELMFPNLRLLKIKQCPKLRIKPCLPRAICLWIEDCDNMLSSWGESSTHISASSSSPITELIVEDSKVPMHQWRLLYHLPALRALTIRDCSDLSTSPDMTQHLSSIDLECLKLSSLDQAELPNWLAKLTSLQELTLEFCKSMTSLPQWLGELTTLKKIEVEQQCTELVKWLKSKENKKFFLTREISMLTGHMKVRILGESDDEPNEEGIRQADEETTNSQDTESGSQRMNKRPRDDGVSNRSSPPPSTQHPTRAPCTPLGLLMASPPATSLAGDGAQVDVLPRPGDTLTNATYNADDEGPLLGSSSGSWASLQRARKGKDKQSETDLLVDVMDVPFSKRSRRPLELWDWGQYEETTIFSEAASMVAGASASSPPTLSLDLNVAATASPPPVLGFGFNAAAGPSSPPVSSLDLNLP